MIVPISENDFLKIFSESVYKKIIKETSIKEEDFSYSVYKEKLRELYASIKDNNYCPDNPRDFLLLPKTKYVARTIPLLTYKDESFYYFVCKMIEDDITENRVANTFGGWRLGGKIRKMEEDDLETIRYVTNSYNPFLWTSQWKEFRKVAQSFTDSKKYNYVLKLDISNFYDSINLNILFNKLYKTVNKSNSWCVDCLSFFLKYWNKKVDNYLPRSQGLPQTEFGDQSRLLANFYLQDYDVKVKEICDKNGIEYIRYADDQILFLKDKNYHDIMLIINQELNKIGLNLNPSKTELLTIEAFSQYWLFKPLSLLDGGHYSESLMQFYLIYLKNQNVRVDTYLKRIMSKSIGFESFNLKDVHELLNTFAFDDEFLLCCESKHYKKIYDFLEEDKRPSFIFKLEELKEEIKFNSVAAKVDEFLFMLKK